MSVVTKTLHLLSGIVLGKGMITLTIVKLREFDSSCGWETMHTTPHSHHEVVSSHQTNLTKRGLGTGEASTTHPVKHMHRSADLVLALVTSGWPIDETNDLALW